MPGVHVSVNISMMESRGSRDRRRRLPAASSRRTGRFEQRRHARDERHRRRCAAPLCDRPPVSRAPATIAGSRRVDLARLVTFREAAQRPCARQRFVRVRERLVDERRARSAGSGKRATSASSRIAPVSSGDSTVTGLRSAASVSAASTSAAACSAASPGRRIATARRRCPACASALASASPAARVHVNLVGCRTVTRTPSRSANAREIASRRAPLATTPCTDDAGGRARQRDVFTEIRLHRVKRDARVHLEIGQLRGTEHASAPSRHAAVRSRWRRRCTVWSRHGAGADDGCVTGGDADVSACESTAAAARPRCSERGPCRRGTDRIIQSTTSTPTAVATRGDGTIHCHHGRSHATRRSRPRRSTNLSKPAASSPRDASPSSAERTPTPAATLAPDAALNALGVAHAQSRTVVQSATPQLDLTSIGQLDRGVVLRARPRRGTCAGQ